MAPRWPKRAGRGGRAEPGPAQALARLLSHAMFAARARCNLAPQPNGSQPSSSPSGRGYPSPCPLPRGPQDAPSGLREASQEATRSTRLLDACNAFPPLGHLPSSRPAAAASLSEPLGSALGWARWQGRWRGGSTLSFRLGRRGRRRPVTARRRGPLATPACWARRGRMSHTSAGRIGAAPRRQGQRLHQQSPTPAPTA